MRYLLHLALAGCAWALLASQFAGDAFLALLLGLGLIALLTVGSLWRAALRRVRGNLPFIAALGTPLLGAFTLGVSKDLPPMASNCFRKYGRIGSPSFGNE